MKSKITDLIEYSGITDICKDNIEDFKLVNVDFMYNLPIERDSIGEILKVWGKAKIVKDKIVDTPKGKSLEGKIVTGKNMLIMGDIDLKIEYISATSDIICTTYGKYPFGTYLPIPDSITWGQSITVNAVIQDIVSKKFDDRSIYNNLSLVLVSDFL